MHLLFFSNLFSTDMIVIILVALMLFGGEKLPEIARGLGKGIRDFKEASDGIKREINDHINSLDEKKADQALDQKAEEIRNHQGLPTGTSEESRSPVNNTTPVNDSHFTSTEHQTTENHAEANHEPVAAEHQEGTHTEAGAANNEVNKNS
jgi:sec-independent protein translocase protein TatA